MRLGFKAFCLLLSTAGISNAATLARWVQYAPGDLHAANAPASLTNTILVRAVVTDVSSCPTALLDHDTALTMQPRFAAGDVPAFVQAGSGAFADGTPHATENWGACEAIVPPGHRTVTVDGADLKLPVPNPRRILVIGDTGCRLREDADTAGVPQDCDGPAAFPFKYLAEFEATLQPDVIVHVGDWTHREKPCAPGAAGCVDGAPWGDTFDAWNADLFAPAKTLLAAAPWIMLRGHDEACGRGARGWFALLDSWPFDAAKARCTRTQVYPPVRGEAATYTAEFEPSYVVPLGGALMIVHDSSRAEDGAADLDLAENYDVDLTALLNRLRDSAPGKPAIFATHTPTFDRSHAAQAASCDVGHAAAGDESAQDGAAIFGGNLTLQAVFSGAAGHMTTAFYDGVPPGISLFLSGHVRQFRYLNVGTGDSVNVQFAPQLIVGAAGSLLHADCSYDPAHARTESVFGNDAFGFALLTATGNGYTAEIYKASAGRAGECAVSFKSRAVRCRF